MVGGVGGLKEPKATACFVALRSILLDCIADPSGSNFSSLMLQVIPTFYGLLEHNFCFEMTATEGSAWSWRKKSLSRSTPPS
ncbi:MAG: hypothetical protein LH632_01765, partial [Rhodoferax sp.]|nr:hypothetical protein [Rhodoferax sp.]